MSNCREILFCGILKYNVGSHGGEEEDQHPGDSEEKD